MTWKGNNNRIYFPSTSLSGYHLSPPPPDWDSFRMRTLDGGYFEHIPGDGFPAYSLSSTVFQSMLKAQALRAVDLGADGLIIDDIANQVTAITWRSSHLAGTFDAVTMAAFRSYLQHKYTATQLQQNFGITDIAAFDYGNYIHSHGLADSWNSLPLIGLAAEFLTFKRQESIDFLHDLVATTKHYARTTYNRDFLFSVNDNNHPIGYFITEDIDLTTPELIYIRGMDHPFMAVDIKAWQGWKSPTFVFPEAMPPTLGVPDPLTKATVNLERVIIADIQAANGTPGTTLQMNSGLNTPEPVDLAVVARYADFILSHPQIFTAVSTGARTALLQSASSLLGGTFPTPAETNPWDGWTNYIGTARLLLDSGITYNSVFLPDTSYSHLPAITTDTLARYSVVLAPSCWALDDNQVTALLNFAQQGGTLIIDGHFATSQPDGSPANRPAVQTLLSTPGTINYGAGRIVVTQARFGVQYQNADASVQRTTRTAFQTFMAPWVMADVTITQPQATVHEPGVTPFFYRDSSGRALVHLVNYDYDDTADQFHAKTNIHVVVRVGTQPVDAVILRSPDVVGTQSLPFSRTGDVISLTVPTVEAWAILYFQPNAEPPVVSSSTPDATAKVVGGTSQVFTVTATSNNPLTYVWLLNGQVQTGYFGPTFTLQLPTDATGTYTVVAQITDGSHTTTIEWTVRATPYKRPRVLFDESHSERNTLDPTRASQLNPQHPEWVLYGLLNTAMQARYDVSRLATGPITAQVLNSADVLVLAAPQDSLMNAEIQTITSFVQGGGGLMFLGDANMNASINTLIEPWGITFDGHGAIESLQRPNCAGCFYVATFANHPAVGTNPSFLTNYGGTLTTSNGALALGSTTTGEWWSTSGQPTQQPGEPNGPFTMISAVPAAKGKVFVISDNAFHDDYLQKSTENRDLFLSALAWVSGAVNALVPDQVLAATLPSSRSIQTGNTATAFATIFNNSSVQAINCGITPATPVPAAFTFQTTDPATNSVNGTPNAWAPIAPHATQTFVVAFQATAPLAPTETRLNFGCDGASAESIPGVNTLLLTFSATPVPDIIAVGVTPSGDGFARTGGPSGIGLFAVATSNVGATGTLLITARVRPSDPTMPLVATICQTDPVSGVCLTPPASVAPPVAINQNQSTTWSAFLQATGAITADPAARRVFVEFLDTAGVVRGSTSIAVTTQ
jgi:hypothetical protein